MNFAVSLLLIISLATMKVDARPLARDKKVICEGGTMHLSCEQHKTLKITSAMYGRKDSKTCPHISMHNLDCAASTSLQKVKELCEEKQSCMVPSKNEVFGDPCWGTHKYLLANYECVGTDSPPPASPTKCKHDIGLLIDRSPSIREGPEGPQNWESLQQFLRDFVTMVRERYPAVRLAMTAFAENNQLLWNWDQSTDQDYMLKKIDELKVGSGGGTKMDKAFQYMRDEIFGDSSNRKEAPDLMLFMTDGVPNPSEEDPSVTAEELKQQGITIMAVGVTDKINSDLMEKISSPSYSVNLKNYQQLADDVERIMVQTCQPTAIPSTSPVGPEIEPGSTIPETTPAAQIPGPIPETTPAGQSLGPVPETTPADQNLGPVPETTPADQGLGPVPETTPADQSLGPVPETGPADQSLGPVPETTPADQSLGPVPETTPADQSLGAVPETTPADQILGAVPETTPADQGLGPVPETTSAAQSPGPISESTPAP